MNSQLTCQRSFCASQRHKTRSRCSHHRSARSRICISWLFHCRICTRVVSPFARANGATEAHNASSSPSLVAGVVAVCRTYVEMARNDGAITPRRCLSCSLAVPLSLFPRGSWHTRAESGNCFNVLITGRSRAHTARRLLSPSRKYGETPSDCVNRDYVRYLCTSQLVRITR